MNEKVFIEEETNNVEIVEEQEKYFCQYCGQELKLDDKYCGNCGKSTEVKEEVPLVCECGASYQSGQKYCSKCGAKLEKTIFDKIKVNESSVVEDEITDEDISENKGMAVLCYLGILLLIPLLTKPQSKYIRFHSNQGIILMLAGIILTIIFIIPILGWIVGLLGYIFIGVCGIMGIINAIKGKVKRLPLIGKYNILK